MAKKVERLINDLKKQNAQHHICGFYKDPDERLALLSAYYSVGIERGELCILVTDQPSSSLIKSLREYGLDIQAAIDNKDFQIFAVQPTYLPDNSFASIQMLDNLRGFSETARKKNYPGVRGGGDMDWLAEKPEAWEAVTTYESKINRFIRTNKFSGLCLFREQLLNKEIVQRIIQTHTLIIKNCTLESNPFYKTSSAFFKFDINLVAAIEEWMDDLDRQEMLQAAN